MKVRFYSILGDILIIVTSLVLPAYWLHVVTPPLGLLLIVVCVIKISIFSFFGLYHAILRFAGFPLAINVIKAAGLSSLIIVLVGQMSPFSNIPISVLIIDFLNTVFLVGMSRFAPRYKFEFWKKSGTKRILIYGAGDLGDELARKLLRDSGDYHLVGFLDDSPDKIGKRLHNLGIYGPKSNLTKILTQNHISEVIIAIPELRGEQVRSFMRECRKSDVMCRIAPMFEDTLKQDINIKNIDISDLLKRKPRDLDEKQIRSFVKGKVVLITGAGGSIGSELASQCIHYGAQRLVLVDNCEFNLYSIKEKFKSSKTEIRYCLRNVLNHYHMKQLMGEERPAILFHAAAYKHVPIVEENACEGIINNVQGTIITSQLAEEYGVEKYVFISTDKAVRPTSIMGASKRIGELYVQNYDGIAKETEFIAVRFGNVLGSSGSVIPKFIEQINNGEVVTVTHPEMTRYFMLTSEAVQLVLEAGSIGNGGELFILDMGKPVRIAEMAEDIIFLSGRKLNRDIKIEYTGLRPGEKLYEELLFDEAEKKTQYEDITIGRTTKVDWYSFIGDVESLLAGARKQEREAVLGKIKQLVPEFQHAGCDDQKQRENEKVLRLRSVS